MIIKRYDGATLRLGGDVRLDLAPSGDAVFREAEDRAGVVIDMLEAGHLWDAMGGSENEFHEAKDYVDSLR